MRLHQSGRRYAARFGVAALAAIALGASALPAQAGEEEPAVFAGYLPDATISAGSAGKVVQFQTYRHNAVNPKVSIDLIGLLGVANAEFPDGCKIAKNIAECSIDEVGPTIFITLTPSPGAKPGAQGKVTYHMSADNLPTETDQATITLAGSGVDLVVPFSGETDKPVKPGDAVEVPVNFYNAGDKPATGVELIAFFSYGMTPEQYENCEYGQDPDIPFTVVRCSVEEEILPGIDYFTVAPFGATAAPDAWGIERADYLVWPLDGAPELGKKTKLTRGTGKKLTLVAKGPHKRTRAADLDEQDNYGFYYWNNVKNTRDLAAVGGTVTGSVGDTVPIRIGVKNNGAAALDSVNTGESPTNFSFLVPAGVTVASTPQGCRAMVKDSAGHWQFTDNGPGGLYVCYFPGEVFHAGESFLVTFQAKITSLTGAPGQVTLVDPRIEDPKYRWTDDNPTNDTAAVTVAAGDGSGGGSGAGDGGLPVTGAKAGLITAGGAALLAAGAALFLVARRRRVVLVAGDDEKTTA